jgi:D-tyrosyl-tRNA(Tyr) deacylase
LVDKEIIFTENLNLEKINQYDFIIFASKHQSEKPNKLFHCMLLEIGEQLIMGG